MRLPLDPYFSNFLAMTDNAIGTMDRSTGVYFWNMRYKDGFLPYGGDFSIKLQSGLTIRIPNQQLVMPHTAVDRTTGAVAVNTTGPDLLIDSLQDVEKDKLAQLGWQFLTAAYLMVNQDAGQFSLWAANPTADEDLVAVDAAGAEMATASCASATASGSSSSSTSSNTHPGADTAAKAGDRKATPTAAIAGAAVGAVCALLLLSGSAVFLVRRRRRRATEDKAAFARFDGSSQTSSAPSELVELGAGQRAAAHHVYEAPANEVRMPLEKWPKSPLYEMAA